jgi:hypothetical protein
MYNRVRLPNYIITNQNHLNKLYNNPNLSIKYNNNPFNFKYTIPLLTSTNQSNVWLYHALQPKYEYIFWMFINLTS